MEEVDIDRKQRYHDMGATEFPSGIPKADADFRFSKGMLSHLSYAKTLIEKDDVHASR